MARLGPIVSLQLPAVDLEAALGHTDRALERLDALLARTENPAWVARRGDVLLRAGRSLEARHEYARARTLIAFRHRSARGRGFSELDRRLDTTLASLTRMETQP
jgi:predicted negative regulator of RcsB-dependent stress response